jgi:hypothetical protein
MAIYARSDRDLDGLVHHSDRGVQYLAIRFTEHVRRLGLLNSMGTVGDCYDCEDPGVVINRSGRISTVFASGDLTLVMTDLVSLR